MLLVGGVAGGTLAWMTDQTTPRVNTFALADLGITIAETPTSDGDSNPNTNSYTMLPGASITKDPVVTLPANSADAWLFVQMDKSENFDSFLTFSMADGWTPLDGVQGVYWRTTQKSDVKQTFDVIRNHTVTVKPDVTAAQLNTLTESTRPTLAVTAYAVQLHDVNTALEAWALVESQSITP